MNAEIDLLDRPESFLDIYLQPGDLFWGSENTRLRTLLGSCVAIVIWHPVYRCGGMCHYLLPRGGSDPRYADGAMDMFMCEIENSGLRAGEYLARIFGGGNMFEAASPENHPRHIGHANVEAAYSLLDRAGIPIIAADTGGTGYRKVIFECWSGRVWMKRQEQSVVSGGKG